jgi:hypothetical protein
VTKSIFIYLKISSFFLNFWMILLLDIEFFPILFFRIFRICLNLFLMLISPRWLASLYDLISLIVTQNCWNLWENSEALKGNGKGVPPFFLNTYGSLLLLLNLWHVTECLGFLNICFSLP